MQVYERKKCEMIRDMDLIRDLLLHIENDPIFDGNTFVRADTPDELGISGHSMEELAYHLTLLIEAGLLKGNHGLAGMPEISRLTWDGHEFAANISDQGIWAKTKERIKGLPGVALSIVVEIAKAEIKKHFRLP